MGACTLVSRPPSLAHRLKGRELASFGLRRGWDSLPRAFRHLEYAVDEDVIPHEAEAVSASNRGVSIIRKHPGAGMYKLWVVREAAHHEIVVLLVPDRSS